MKVVSCLGHPRVLKNKSELYLSESIHIYFKAHWNQALERERQYSSPS